jgi:hypothetical protein
VRRKGEGWRRKCARGKKGDWAEAVAEMAKELKGNKGKRTVEAEEIAVLDALLCNEWKNGHQTTLFSGN